MDINETPHRIACTQPIETHFQTTEPEDPRQDPIAFRKGATKGCIMNFTSRPSTDKYGAFRCTCTDLGTDRMPATWRAAAAVQLSRTIPGSVYSIRRQQLSSLAQPQALLIQAYFEPTQP